jgi:hypothetical protein
VQPVASREDDDVGAIPSGAATTARVGNFNGRAACRNPPQLAVSTECELGPVIDLSAFQTWFGS